MYKVLITYYKETGKCYSGGSYTSTKKHLYQIIDEVKEMIFSGTVPGMVEGYRPEYATIDVPDHPNNHPHVFVLKKIMGWRAKENISNTKQKE